MSTQAEALELQNGQVWRQLNFPHFEIVVLMLPCRDGDVMYCRASTGDWRSPPLIMTDVAGCRWLYTSEDLLIYLQGLGYTLAGAARITIVGSDEEASAAGGDQR